MESSFLSRIGLRASNPGNRLKDIVRLGNAVANYDWGSHTLLADLLGEPRSPAPQAELWMGAHAR